MAMVKEIVRISQLVELDVHVEDSLPLALMEEVFSKLNCDGASVVYGPNPTWRQLLAYYMSTDAFQRFLERGRFVYVRQDRGNALISNGSPKH